ncbi:SCO3242 family prenyltransferase [Streptomyces sp. NPDC005808]|uniref:SCO3242 family prenyltransferase n=1 Tax=Streptomyces sp. NPDC005808 TaxID=3364734 RepID=UPI00369DB536
MKGAGVSAGAGAGGSGSGSGSGGTGARADAGNGGAPGAGAGAGGDASSGARAGVSAGARAGAGVSVGGGASSGARPGARARAGSAWAWAELLRLPALFTVPGDALTGAAAVGARPNSRTLLAIGSSLCLYEAGMALNDWADRAEDAVDRPHRPLPSGRIHPAAALAAAGALTAAGLALAARAGGRSFAVAAPLAATIWAYDLVLKQTSAGPAAMATARGLDVLLGATTTGSAPRAMASLPGPSTPGRTAVRLALPSALTLAAHTFAVTVVSRGETQGGSSAAPLAALVTTGALAWGLLSDRGVSGQPGRRPMAVRAQDAGGTPTPPHPGRVDASGPTSDRAPIAAPVLRIGQASVEAPVLRIGRASVEAPVLRIGRVPIAAPVLQVRRAFIEAPELRRGRIPVGAPRLAPTGAAPRPGPSRHTTEAALRGALTLVYALTFARPLFHAALNPSPPLTQRAVGGGIRAMIPLQAALAARAGAPVTALLTAALAPAARKFARKVSVT